MTKMEASHELVERLRQEARIHAQEARTANATIAEIYQICTGSKGEPGNWNGAEPVRQLAKQRAELLEALQMIAESGADSTTGEGHADCCQIARFALAGREIPQQRNATGGEG